MSIVCLTPLHAACIFGLSAVQGEHENPQESWRKENNCRTCSIPIQPLRMKLGELSELFICVRRRDTRLKPFNLTRCAALMRHPRPFTSEHNFSIHCRCGGETQYALRLSQRPIVISYAALALRRPRMRGAGGLKKIPVSVG